MEHSEPTAAALRRAAGRPRGYPALDGVRAVAVLAVLLYHFGVGAMGGGFLGVDVFFVLSGYLITAQLVTRWVLGGGISLRSFWTARARRLLPALGAVLVASTTAVIVADRGQLALFRGDLTAAATYSSNWWYVFHQRSYFAASGRPPVLQHLWSLAVEEQFYLVWPLVVACVVALCSRCETRLRLLLAGSVAVGAGSSLVMGIGSAMANAPEAGDPSRWYFGSDSHVMGLMAGATLALVRRGDGLGAAGPAAPARPVRPVHTIIGAGALALLLTAFWRAGEHSTWLYRWGFLAVSLLTVVVIAVATRPGPLATGLDRPLLRGLGRRSYGLYLWHWPVVCFTRPGLDLPVSDGAAFALRLGLTLLLAEVSYQWVEQPVRRLGWRSAWRLVCDSRVGSLRVPTVITVAAAALVTGVVLPASATPSGPHYPAGGTVYVSRPGRSGSVHVRVVDPASAPPAAGLDGRPGPSARTPSGLAAPHQPPLHAGVDLRRYDLVVYGDSVPLGAIPDLAAKFRTVTNDAAVGAQAWTLLPQLVSDAGSGRLNGAVVLIHTGDNGLINRQQLGSALSALTHSARVVLAMPFVPRPWQDDNRKTVESVAAHFPQTALLDWVGAARGHPEYVGSDGIHLTSSGEHAYARLVAAAAVGS